MLTLSMTQDAMKNITKINPWIGTPLESYALLDPKNKGSFGEELVKIICRDVYNLNIKNRTNPGHDAIINGIKAEIKFSAATKRNTKYEFTFNHIGLEKDWERIIFMGVNGDLNERIVWFYKRDIEEILKTSTCISHQQGGKNSNNDDYISANKNSQLLMNHPLAKSMQQWS